MDDYMESVHSQNASNSPFWLGQKIPPLNEWLSAVPSSIKDFLQNPELENPAIVLDIVKRRLFYRRKFLVSVLNDERDVLPSSSLQTGITKALAVCRVAQYFTREDFQRLISEIQEALKQQPQNQNFDSIQKLREIFLFPEQVATSIKSLIDKLDNSQQMAARSITFETSLERSLVLLEAFKRLSLDDLAYINPIPLGTGFLVGSSYLLTNHHVIPDKKSAIQCVAQFNFVEDALGYTQSTIDYDFDADLLFETSERLDYTIVKLKSNLSKQQAGYNFGWLQLIENDKTIAPGLKKDEIKSLKVEIEQINPNLELSKEDQLGESVIIIHHPKGLQKKIDVSNNRVIQGGLLRNYLRYRIDSDYGSSGSPIFNTKWDLVALHHAAIPRSLTQSSADSERLVQQGIRICRIVEDLKQKSLRNFRLRGFVEESVITSEQLKYPPLPAALELNGLKDYIQIDSTNTSDSQAFSIEAWINLTRQQEKSTIFTAFCREVWAEEESTLGNVLLHCYLTPEGELVLARKQVFNSYLASSLLYPANRLILFYPKRYAAHPSIREGDEGTRIKAFKQFFNLISGLELSLEEADKFSEKDVEVVKKFQENHKDRDGDSLEVDGIVGPITLDTLWQSLNFKKGDRSSAIRDLRYLLTLIDIELFSREMLKTLSQESDEFCEQMEAAIKIYQEKRKLNVEVLGAIDYKTLDSLWAYGLYLREGNQAQSVKDLQLLLSHLKHQVSATKTFGEDTKKAIEQFQERNRLGVDGIVGQRTLEVLLNTQSYELRAQNFPQFVPEGFIQIFQKENGLVIDGIPGPGTIRLMVETTKLSLGTYSHVVVTYDGQTLRLLVNGKELPFNTSFNAREKLRLDHANATTHFVIGAYAEVAERVSEQRSCHFQGSFAELRIWKRDRTQEIKTEFSTNYFQRLNGDESGLIGYWRFEEAITLEDQVAETNQPIAKELSNRAINAELVGKIVSKTPRSVLATYFPPLPLPFGLEFDEVGDTLQFSNFQLASGNTGSITSITIEAWVRYIFGNGLIVSQRDGDKNGFSFGFQDEQLFVELQQGKNTTNVELESHFPTDLVWHHIAITWDSESEIWMYLDGRTQPIVVLEADKTKSMIIQGHRRAIGLFQSTINLKDSTLYIGEREENDNHFHVAIAEVRIWKNARTQDQIKTNQFRRLRGDCKGDEEDLVGYWRLDDDGQSSIINNNDKGERSNPPKPYPQRPSSFL
jgi:peptidoglycan hydrolase-like protein with peptidoglycan-binding domain/V8-like Glu-specific endopeptidase